MKTKWLMIIWLIVMLAVSQASSAAAKGSRLFLPAVVQGGTDNQENILAEKRWVQMSEPGFGNPYSAVTALENFQNHLYAATTDLWGAGAGIYRTRDGFHWQAVTQPAFGNPPPPEGYILRNWIYDLYEFNGQLYAGYDWNYVLMDEEGNWLDYIPGGGQIWRTPDGIHWEAVVADGLGDPWAEGVTNFVRFHDMLYAGASGWFGFQIWRSPSGDSGTWEIVARDGLGDITNSAVTGMAVFQGKLYITTESWWDYFTPVRVWSTWDGVNWEPVTLDGFGDPNNVSPGGFGIYRGRLYLGMQHAVNGAQLWRTANGADWEPVITDALGDPGNWKIDSLFTYQRYFYAGVDNLAGMSVWRSLDGVNWTKAADMGFGNPLNMATLWSNAVTAFKTDLCYGTWGLFGEAPGAVYCWTRR